MPNTTAGGVSIHYDEFGDGEPLLLSLTGWCADRTHFDAVAKRLAPRHRVVTFDWRGHGASGTPSADFGSEELVEDALAVIAACGPQTIVPISTAHAGWVAIELRRRLGARVSRLVLLDWIVLDPPPPFLAALGAMRDPDTCKPTLDQLFDMWLAGCTDRSVIDFVREGMASYPPEMWARAGREIAASYAREGNPLKALAALDPPLPVLHFYALPKEEGFLAAQQSFAKEHPWYQVQRVDTLTHFPTSEAPDRVAAAIEAFVAGLEPAPVA